MVKRDFKMRLFPGGNAQYPPSAKSVIVLNYGSVEFRKRAFVIVCTVMQHV